MKKITLLALALFSALALNAQTITQTTVTTAEIATDASDNPNNMSTDPATIAISIDGFAPSTTVQVFSQFRNAAGDQFAGGALNVTTDATGSGTANFAPGFFGGGTFTADQNVTWNTQTPDPANPSVNITASQNFPATLAVTAKTITQTVVTTAEITTDASDKPNGMSTDPATIAISIDGLDPNRTYKVFSQFRNAAGDQFAGGALDVTTDATGSGTANFTPGFFGGGTFTADQDVTWNTQIETFTEPDGTVITLAPSVSQTFPATLATLGTKVNENKLSASYFSANKNAIVIGDKVAGDYTIYNITGKTVQQGAVSNEINVEGLSSGVYILSTEAGVLKIVK